MKVLDDYLNDENGSRKRGAVAAAARHLHVCHNTVKRWAAGEWTPSRHKKEEILHMIYDKIPLAPKKRVYAKRSKSGNKRKRAK